MKITPLKRVFCLILLLGITLFIFSDKSVSLKSPDRIPLASSMKELSLTLTQRQQCDLEMLLNGGFAPLETFLSRQDYDSVVENVRLANGKVWPIPITLDINASMAEKSAPGTLIQLKDEEGKKIASLTVSEIWKPNKEKEAEKVFGTTNRDHPGVDYLLGDTEEYYVSGKITPISTTEQESHFTLQKTPKELKAYFKMIGAKKVIGFQTRNPMHKAHFALTRYASKKTGGHLLIHPVVGMTKPDDINAFTRIRCYKKIMSRYPKGSATLSLLPLAIRMGGPREAVWHAIIRKNYGCTHFIVGRDHSGPGKDRHGNLFYSPYEAQEMLAKYAPEIGITPIFSKQLVYVKNQDKFLPIDKLQKEDQVITMSGTEIRRRLKSGEEIPTWFSFPEVITELKRAFPPPEKKGLTLFFTGYSGSGKSALGKVLYQRLKDAQDRTVSFLDGDVIRTHLSKGLGFTKEDRSINVRRAGFVASEITKNRGIVICSLIAPYEADRKFNRELISANGDYIEIYLSTPLEVCEKRDVKGLYAKARRGEVKHFTGIDEIYEVPKNPTLVFDTTDVGIDELVEEIISYLSEKGYINEIEKEKTA